MLKQQRTNSSLRIFLLLFALCHSSSRGYTQIRILFDATKGEMAGNADWVIDADQTNIGVGSGGPYITTSGNKSNLSIYLPLHKAQLQPARRILTGQAGCQVGLLTALTRDIPLKPCPGTAI
jgi:hypothetical protein